VANIFEKKFAHYLDSLKHDPMVESNFKNNNLIMKFALKVAIEDFPFMKHNQGILGVNS
jgi:hypothetical protein